MAIVITKTVKTAGGDYTTLKLAIAGELVARPNLVTNDQQLDIECYNGVVDSQNVDISGFTTDATRFIRVKVPAAEPMTGVWDNARFRVDVSNDHGITINDNFVRLEGLQIRISNSGGTVREAVLIGSSIAAGAFDIRLKNVYLRGTGAGGSGIHGFMNSTVDDAGGKVFLINVVADGFHDLATTCRGFNFRATVPLQQVYAYNCTTIRCQRGFNPATNVHMKNCVAINSQSDFGSTAFHASSEYNGGTKIGNGNVGANNQQPVAIFMLDPLNANPDFRLSPADTGIKQLGKNLSADPDFAFNDDIAGNARPATWTMGAFEPQGAAVQGVRWLRVGGVTPTAAQIKARMILASESGPVNLKVSTAVDLSSPLIFGPTTAKAADNEVATFNITGLAPNTTYFYGVDTGGSTYARQGKFKTMPIGATSFSFAFSGDADTGTSDPAYDNILAANPAFFLNVGDAHYDNIASNDITLFRKAYERLHLSLLHLKLQLNLPIVYTWDDHDWGPSNSDKSAPGAQAAKNAYRENAPHHTLPAGDPGAFPIYHSFVAGRCRFIITDSRADRSPNNQADTPAKSMLGTAQKQWFKDQVLAGKAAGEVMFWLTSSVWIDSSASPDDSWGNFATERKELSDFLQANQIFNLIRLSGDAHMIAVDDGTNDKFTSDGLGPGLVTLHATPLMQNGILKGGPYSHGTFLGTETESEGQWGLVTITDDGAHLITVAFSGKRGNTELVAFSTQFVVPPVTGATPLGITVQNIFDGALAYSSANPAVFRSLAAREILTRVNATHQALFVQLAELNHHHFARHEQLPSSSEASSRTLQLSQLTVPVERIVALRLPAGTDINVVDIADLNAELAPRAFPLGEVLNEVGAEWGTAGPILVDIWYAYHPADLDLNGSLDQSLGIPARFGKYFEVDLAAYLAHKDFGRAGSDTNEIARLEAERERVYADLVAFVTHEMGPETRRFLPTVPTVAGKA